MKENLLPILFQVSVLLFFCAFINTNMKPNPQLLIELFCYSLLASLVGSALLKLALDKLV